MNVNKKILIPVFTIILIMLTSLLYFFNIFSLPYPYKKFFTWIPKKELLLSEISLECPLLPHTCQTGADFNKDGQYIGLQLSNLVGGEPVRAIFDGELKLVKSEPVNDTSNGNFPFLELSLTNPDTKMTAVYRFRGSPIKPKEVNKGATIGVISGERLANYDNSQFIISLMRSSQTQPIRLDSSLFKKQ